MNWETFFEVTRIIAVTFTALWVIIWFVGHLIRHRKWPFR